MKLKMYSFFILAFAFVVILSCKKEDDKAEQEEAEQSIKDNADAQSVFDNIFTLVDDNMSQATDDSKYINRDIDTGCPTVTITNENGLITSLIIDFGDVYCTPNPNKTDQYKGKLIVTANGRYREAGTVLTTTLEDFYFNDYHIEGTKTVTNLGRDTDSLFNYSIVIAGGKLTAPNGVFKSWQSTRNRKWMQGENTIWWPFDDVYEITGTASGTNVLGNTYEIVVNNPLWIRVGCRFVQQGTLTVTTNSNSVEVDYGTYQNNVCDRSVTYTVNGNDYTYAVE